MLIEMTVTLGERDRDAVGVERLFDFFGQFKIDAPVIR